VGPREHGNNPLERAQSCSGATLGRVVGHCVDFFHRARAAILAISERSSGESFVARALPPTAPPALPRATAAGLFSGSGPGAGASPMISR
jgi:hypothetical protein